MKKFTLVLLSLFFFYSDLAYASTCSTSDRDSRYKQATVVFIGRAISDTNPEKCGPHETLFQVIESFKGRPESTIRIHSTDGCIGIGNQFAKDKDYLVYASPDKFTFDAKTGQNLKTLSSNACSGSMLTEYVKKEVLFDLTEKNKSLSTLDNNIQTASTDTIIYLLRFKAEHLLYWQDYIAAENVLREILNHDPSNTWSHKELIQTLFKQNKSQEIFELHTRRVNSHNDHRDLFADEDYQNHVNFSFFNLGKTNPPDDSSWSFKNLEFNGLEREKNTIKVSVMENIQLNGVNFSDSTLNIGLMKGIYINKSNFKNTSFKNTRIEDANFYETDMEGTDFSQSSIEGLYVDSSSILTGSNFEKSKITNAVFSNGNLSNVNFTNAHIINSNLRGANLENALLKGTSLRGSEYDCATQWPQDFDPDKAGATSTEICANNPVSK